MTRPGIPCTALLGVQVRHVRNDLELDTPGLRVVSSGELLTFVPNSIASTFTVRLFWTCTLNSPPDVNTASVPLAVTSVACRYIFAQPFAWARSKLGRKVCGKI